MVIQVLEMCCTTTTKTEYTTIIEDRKEDLWMTKILEELSLQQENYVVYNNSKSVIHLSKNSTFHSRSKHIHVRYH